MNDKTTGFILKQADYKERDLILTVLSQEYGRISFIAAGVKKLSSKNAGAVLPYTKAEFLFDYKEKRNMFRMKTAHTVSLYRYLHEDLKASAAAAVAAEIMDLFTSHENEDTEREYRITEQAFTALNSGKDPDLVLALVMSDVMRIFGILPDVDECSECGSTTATAVSLKHGGFLCARCAEEAGIPVWKKEDLKRFRLLCKAGMEHLEIVESHTEVRHEDTTLLLSFLETYSGMKIRSFSFYHRLFDH